MCYGILHKQTIRGDVAVIFELSVLLLLWTTARTARINDVLIQSRLITPAFFTCYCATVQLTTLVTATLLYRIAPWHPLATFPGPISFRLSSIFSAWDVASGMRYRSIVSLHKQYGTFVRIGEYKWTSSKNCSTEPCLGPNAISINSRAAIGPIYAAAQSLDRSSMYSMKMFPGKGLFFSQTKEDHNPRRAIWARAFTNAK